MKKSAVVAGLIVVAVVAVWSLVVPRLRERDDPRSAQERARLALRLEHAAPGSAAAETARRALERLEDSEKNEPEADSPDVFARILWEMRIPSDRTVPDYVPGYRARELAKAPRAPVDKSLNWISRGPGNVAGRARGIIVDPDDSTGMTWFIASVGGGVWKTADGGATWAPLTDDQPVLAVQSLAMDPLDHDVLYAGTGESYFNIDTMNGDGILKSTDRGATWAPLAATVDTPVFNNVSRIIVSPTTPGLVLASTTVGTYKGSLHPYSYIMRSTDGGTTWTAEHTEAGAGTYGGPRILQLAADPTDFDVQYATVFGAGIMKSTDAGLNWTYINNGITDFTGRFELAISPVNTQYLYASAQGASHSELWVSWDGGANWNETFESGTEPDWLGAQGWYDDTIVCDPGDATVVFVGGPELWKITLAGIGSTSRTTVELASYSFPHPDHHALAVVEPGGGGWFLLDTNDGGVARTASGSTGFTMPIDGMVTTQFYGIDKRPGASAYFGGMQDNGTWQSPLDPTAGTPWTARIGGDGYETSWNFDDPQKLIGGYQFNGLKRSLDGGTTWNAAVSGLSDTGSGAAPFITKIAAGDQMPDRLFAVGSSGVWRSTDFGGSWSLASVNASDWGALSSFHDVRVSGADPDVVYAGARMDANGRIVVSTDGGQTFNATSVWPDVTMGRISGLATHPTQPGTAYALFSYAERPKILETDDYGVSWHDISGFGTGSVSATGFPDVAVYDLLVWPNDTQKIWVATEIGLVESTDGGASWALANNGLPAVGIWYLTAVEDQIVAGTHGRGIWTVTDPTLLDGRTFKPLFETMVQSPSGDIDMEFNLRTPYDSTQIWVDGSKLETVGPNTPMQAHQASVPVTTAGTRTAYARAFKDGATYDSVTKSVDALVYSPPVFAYNNDFNTPSQTDDFALANMSWSLPANFGTGALHSQHPYADNTTSTALLLTPIRVSTLTTLSFNQVAIIEPGETGSVYGDADFWDYAVVEGSLDGVTWTPLAPGWDCRDDSAWLTAFYTSQNGTMSMYRNRTLTLNDVFSPNDVVLLRFRMYADAAVYGWGWAVDDIVIDSTGATGAGDTPRPALLSQNFPNPFNPRTTIAYSLDRPGRVRLRIFDAMGRVVRTLVDQTREAGSYQAVWDGNDDRGRSAAAGVYLYRLEAGGTTSDKKMTLVR